MKILKKIFYFLSGIYCAIMLIALAAITIIMGTIIESKTSSHQLAAQWTYEHPLFLVLLGFFFINILFSALRRWPFKKRHIPFLMTHLGLLMIITGTVIKNRFGLQGNLFVWEGSGHQEIVLPHTHALYIEKKDSTSNSFIKETIPLKSLQRNIYYPSLFSELKCKVLGYAPHVKQQLETWIKGSNAYLMGYPVLPVHVWNPMMDFPKSMIHHSSSSSSWSLLALRTSDRQKALREAYLQKLTLCLSTKKNPQEIFKIPLQKAIHQSFEFAEGVWTITLKDLDSFWETNKSPVLQVKWQAKNAHDQEHLHIDLHGAKALYIQPQESWSKTSFHIDLERPYPSLYLIEDEYQNTLLFATDHYGRLHAEHFNSSQLNTLIAYEEGFGGYTVQAHIPFPSFPTSRSIKEQADAFELTRQLRKTLNHHPLLNSPLRLFKEACDKQNVDFSETFVQFLTAWKETSNFLFYPTHSLPINLELVLQALDWNDIPEKERQVIPWVTQFFDRLEALMKEGEDLVGILKQHHWPFLEQIHQAIEKHSISPLNLLAQQFFMLVDNLPFLKFPSSLSLQQQAYFFSAYLRAYDIDEHLLSISQDSHKEPFDLIESYWKNLTDDFSHYSQGTTFETPLTYQIIPDHPFLKLEENCPGIILEVQQGSHKQTLVLAYDASGTGIKWPILNANYTIRFQPVTQALPYHIRLRQARQLSYPQSSQIFSYESDIFIHEKEKEPIAYTLSMNHVYETWEGYRFYLAGIGTSIDQSLKRIQLVVNYDPAKYFLTYPGALLVFLGTILLFWARPYTISEK